MVTDPRQRDERPPASTASAPPTAPGVLGHVDRETNWPVAGGILLLVIGGLGAMNGVSNLFGPWISGLLADQMQAPVFDVMERWKWALFSASLFGALLGIMACIAGGGLIVRRKWSVLVALLWAPLKIAVSIGSAIITYYVQDGVFQSIPAGTMPAGLGKSIGIFTALVIVFLGVIVPIICIFWLRRPSVRKEIAEWR